MSVALGRPPVPHRRRWVVIGHLHTRGSCLPHAAAPRWIVALLVIVGTSVAQPVHAQDRAARVGEALGAWFSERVDRGTAADRRAAQQERRLWYVNPAFGCQTQESEYGVCSELIASERDRRALLRRMAAAMNAPISGRETFVAARRATSSDAVRRTPCESAQRAIAIGFTILNLHDFGDRVVVQIFRGEDVAADDCGSGGATLSLELVRSNDSFRVVREQVLRFY